MLVIFDRWMDIMIKSREFSDAKIQKIINEISPR